MPTKVIKLPCKASELAEAIRCFCEHNGSFDTAIVKLVAVESIESLMSGVRFIVTIPKEAQSGEIKEVKRAKLSDYRECVMCKDMECPMSGTLSTIRCQRTKKEGCVK